MWASKSEAHFSTKEIRPRDRIPDSFDTVLAPKQPGLERLWSRRAVLQLCQTQRWLLVSRLFRRVCVLTVKVDRLNVGCQPVLPERQLCRRRGERPAACEALVPPDKPPDPFAARRSGVSSTRVLDIVMVLFSVVAIRLSLVWRRTLFVNITTFLFRNGVCCFRKGDCKILKFTL